jgi:hypothetical protein
MDTHMAVAVMDIRMAVAHMVNFRKKVLKKVKRVTTKFFKYFSRSLTQQP